MFSVGDYVVCPGHGVGQICDIENKTLAQETQSFYIIKVIANGMKVMVPTSTKSGIRGIATTKEIEDVFGLLKNHNVKVDNSTWNRRHRDYMAKVKTGSLVEIADVLRSLYLLKNGKKLSFGEKKMMDQCKGLIVKEMSISQGLPELKIEGEIESIFN